jgi:polyferredoxin
VASLAFAVLGILALLMAYATAVFLKWAAEARTRSHAAVVAFLLGMMVAMLGGALLYYRSPSASSVVAGFWLAGGLMSVGVFLLFAILWREFQKTAEPDGTFTATPLRDVRPFVALVAGLVLSNELLMGLVFSLASGTTWSQLVGGSAGTAGWLVAAVNSPWFLFTMSAEMFLTAVFLRSRLSRPVLAVVFAQSVIMLFSPPALGGATWIELSVVTSSAVMTGLFVYLLEYIYRHPQIAPGFSGYLVGLLAVYAIMMAGLFLWVYYGVGWLFALSVAGEMILYLGGVLQPESLTQGLAEPWQLRPAWAFQVLSFVFVAELFMGALLDVQLAPGVYRHAFPFLPWHGAASVLVAHAFANGFWFIATVTASTWFLAMMGAEMGALAVMKLRESRHRENRVRLGLMIGSYAAFVVFYPSLYLSGLVPNAPPLRQVPMLGWSMGLGSYPVAPGVFGAILLTYVITGILSVFFGRRAICSVFCTAPLMYQGTAIDAMKTFNRSGRIGRKYLSSRLRSLYGVSTGVTMSALVVVSTASFLNSTGRWHWQIAGADPSVFLYTLSFSVLWYVMFVTIPYTGNYNCVTMGWCYTGTIAQAFQKIGFFKLKVRSREVCRACTTLDCAKACPIGLVDMPGHFRREGEFRSSKCCGVGDCIEACPYDNVYISDVRHWVLRRLRRPAAPARRTGAGPSVQSPSRPFVSAGHRRVVVPLPEGSTPLPVISGRRVRAER